MRIATWNIGSAWDGDAKDEIQFISETAIKNSVDILCLQEMITSGTPDNYIEQLKECLGFKYSCYYELSSAHKGNGSMMGLAILSKYVIDRADMFKLTNPGITIIKNGKKICSDDKGILIAQIMYKGRSIKVATGHMLPFHSFNSDSKNYVYLYQEMYSKVKLFCEGFPYIFCGDFNSSKVEKLVGEIARDMKNTFCHATRHNGNQNDYIFISRDWKYELHRVDLNRYDHALCVSEIELDYQSSINIMHISDIHFLNKDPKIDVKTVVAKLDTSDIRPRQFREKIKNIKEHLDYVVVSGDVTTGGQEEGFNLFTQLVEEMQNIGVFPPPDHIIMSPGNHDGGKDDKWRAFSQQLGGNFVRPWLEDIDEDPDDLLLIFSRLFDKEAVTIRGYIEDVVSKKKIHFPFVLDVEKNILIYAFNSASISQTDILLNPADHEIVDRIRTGRKSKDTKILLRILDQQLQIDPARVAPQELFLFDAFMEKIESRIDLTSFYKVAVLHHHISTITALEEVKQFEHVINAGSLKKHLTDRDYQMVMHGHKHYADIFFDSAIENHKKLLVMSGGTVFGYSNGREPGFYLHSLQGNIINSRFIYLDKKRPSDVSLVKLNGDMDIRRGLTMSEIYRNAEYRVVQHINKEVINGQEYWGWSKNIEESKVGVISSAYGLLILGLLRSNEKYYILKREKIINSLWLFRHENGGWGAVSQVNGDGALEATAWIVLAFYMVCSPLYVEALKDLLRILERDDTSINSNFTLCLIINVLCQVMPENEKLPEFCERLLDSAIREAGKIKYWCINCDGNFIRGTEPSIVHTAHAVITLYACQQRGIISRDLETELKGAREILLNRSLWKNTHEAISKQIGAKEDSLVVDYYTVAWVLKALLYMDSFIDSSIIQDAVNRLLNDYQYGYWNYDGCHYIWTLYDAITALKMYLMKR